MKIWERLRSVWGWFHIVSQMSNRRTDSTSEGLIQFCQTLNHYRWVLAVSVQFWNRMSEHGVLNKIITKTPKFQLHKWRIKMITFFINWAWSTMNLCLKEKMVSSTNMLDRLLNGYAEWGCNSRVRLFVPCTWQYPCLFCHDSEAGPSKSSMVGINHPPYSPSLMPVDFFVSPRIKTYLQKKIYLFIYFSYML